MNVTFEKIGENEGKLTVSVEKADYAEKVKAQLKEIGKKKDIPGFRKGHIDMAQLTKRFGKMVKSDVINDVVYHAAVDYIRENKLNVLGSPIPVDVKEINLDDENYTFEYEVALAPDLGIKLDKEVHLPFYNIKVEEHMIEEQDKQLREQNGERVSVEDYAPRAVVKGELIELNDEGSAKEDGIRVEDAIVGPFTFKSQEEAKKFEGSKVGSEVIFNPYASCEGNEAELSSMLHIDRDKTADVRGNFCLVVKEIIVNKPAEHDKKFYDAVFGPDAVHNEEEYKEKLREGIQMALQPNSANLFQRQAEEYLMETYGKKISFSDRLLKKLIQGNSQEELKDEQLEESLAGVKNQLTWDIVENQAAEALGVKVDKNAVEALARNIAAQQLRQYGMFELSDELIDMYVKNMLGDKQTSERIVRQAFIQQLFGMIHAAVTLDEQTVTLDEFRDIVDKLNSAAKQEA